MPHNLTVIQRLTMQSHFWSAHCLFSLRSKLAVSGSSMNKLKCPFVHLTLKVSHLHWQRKKLPFLFRYKFSDHPPLISILETVLINRNPYRHTLFLSSIIVSCFVSSISINLSYSVARTSIRWPRICIYWIWQAWTWNVFELVENCTTGKFCSWNQYWS